jgi:hypothetical protein
MITNARAADLGGKVIGGVALSEMAIPMMTGQREKQLHKPALWNSFLSAPGMKAGAKEARWDPHEETCTNNQH